MQKYKNNSLENIQHLLYEEYIQNIEIYEQDNNNECEYQISHDTIKNILNT